MRPSAPLTTKLPISRVIYRGQLGFWEKGSFLLPILSSMASRRVTKALAG